MRKLFTLSFAIANLVFAQEPSAFNAGGTSPQKTESQILNERLFNLSAQVRNIAESQEGLKSVFEGQLQRMQDVTGKIENLKAENNAIITEVKQHTDSNFALQNENIETIKQSISALGALIKKTNVQMQSQIDAMQEKITALESLQTARLTLTENNDTPIKEMDNISQVRENTSEKLPIDIAIDGVENNVAEIKTENLEALALQTSEIGKVENVQNIEKLSNDTSESQETLIHKQDMESKTDSEGVEDKSIQKVVPIEVARSQNLSLSSDTTKENADSIKAESKNDANKVMQEVDLKKKPLASVFKEGEQFYKDKNYQKADEYLQFAVKGNYKPARGNYLLGEVAFEQKRYEDAIYYYKTSATRYDKADYMPRLMLHSAKSFDALKEKDNAKRFLETLIALYPESTEAMEAKKLIR